MYPKIEKDPGILWTETKFKKKVAINGSRVIAKAGIIGSVNSFEIIVKLISIPTVRMTAI